MTLVLSGQAATRQEIEIESGLGRAMVADRLTTLINLGLLDESTLGQARGGRAPRLLRFCAEAGVYLVAFIDKTMLSVGVADLTGKLLVEHHEEIDLSLGPEAVLQRLCTLFDWALEQHQTDRTVWGIGIAVPGPVELTQDEPFGSPAFHFMPMWQSYPFVEQLIARHRTPVWVRSAVECMALGERKAGSGQGTDNLLFVKLGRGISAGVIADGQLLRGDVGGGGLLGHVVVDESSTEVCSCGNVGCLEVRAGGDAIAREGIRAAKDGRSPQLAGILGSNGVITANDVGIAAQLGDSFSTELLVRSGRLIGDALAAATNMLNPSVIVLGGEVTQTGDLLLSAVRQALYRRAHPLTTRDLHIVKSQMGSSAGLLGAALVVFDTLFTGNTLENWVAYGSPLRCPSFAERLEVDRTPPPRKDRPAPPPGPTVQRSVRK
ncbi:MAG: ROK family protein [Alphaproteobacteria bacterium]